MAENAEQVGIDLSAFSSESAADSVAKLILENKITDARARLTFFDESAAGIWNFETDKKTSLLITIGDLRTVSKDWRVTISPFRVNSTSPLAGVKSCNYLENILALDDAKTKCFDEAIRLNERGEIAAACLANIFWIKDQKIFTPSLETGCLKGTTRSLIVENFAVEETKAELREMENAEDIFLTSSGIGVLRIAELETKRFAEPSEIFENIENFFSKVRTVCGSGQF